MVEQADVYVKNYLAGDIQVSRYCLPENEKDLNISINTGTREKFYVVKDETYLIITPPAEVEVTTCPFSVSIEELLSWETIDNTWKIAIKANSLHPEAPTTVNVNCGDDENP